MAIDDFSNSATPFAGGLHLMVKAKPGASRARHPKIVNIGEGRCAIEIAIAAPPEDGKANRALIAAIADALDVRKSDVDIQSGSTGRLKRISIAGDPKELIRRLSGWLRAGA